MKTKTPAKPSSRKRVTSQPKALPIKVAKVKAIKDPDAIKHDVTPELAELRHLHLTGLRGYEKHCLDFTKFESGISERRPIAKILAFDPGITNVAVAMLDLEHGTEITSKLELPEFALTSTKMRYLELVIEQWIRYFRPDVIAKEGIAYGMTHGLDNSGKMQYIIERLAMDYQIPYMTIGNPSMRAFLKATDRKATKSDVKLRVFQRFNKKEFPSEDETDAFAIGKTAEAILKGEYVVAKSARTLRAESKGKR